MCEAQFNGATSDMKLFRNEVRRAAKAEAVVLAHRSRIFDHKDRIEVEISRQGTERRGRGAVAWLLFRHAVHVREVVPLEPLGELEVEFRKISRHVGFEQACLDEPKEPLDLAFSPWVERMLGDVGDAELGEHFLDAGAIALRIIPRTKVFVPDHLEMAQRPSSLELS